MSHLAVRPHRSTSTRTITSRRDTPSPRGESPVRAPAKRGSWHGVLAGPRRSNHSYFHALHRCLFASFLAAFGLRTRLAYMNRKNAEKLRVMALEGESEKGKAGGVERNEEVYDNDPRYVFMT